MTMCQKQRIHWSYLGKQQEKKSRLYNRIKSVLKNISIIQYEKRPFIDFSYSYLYNRR